MTNWELLKDHQEQMVDNVFAVSGFESSREWVKDLIYFTATSQHENPLRYHHKLYVEAREAEGWSYGLYDENQMTSPMICHYDDLPAETLATYNAVQLEVKEMLKDLKGR